MSSNTKDPGNANNDGRIADAGNWEREMRDKLVFVTGEQPAHHRWGILDRNVSYAMVIFCVVMAFPFFYGAVRIYLVNSFSAGKFGAVLFGGALSSLLISRISAKMLDAISSREKSQEHQHPYSFSRNFILGATILVAISGASGALISYQSSKTDNAALVEEMKLAERQMVAADAVKRTAEKAAEVEQIERRRIENLMQQPAENLQQVASHASPIEQVKLDIESSATAARAIYDLIAIQKDKFQTSGDFKKDCVLRPLRSLVPGTGRQ